MNAALIIMGIACIIFGGLCLFIGGWAIAAFPDDALVQISGVVLLLLSIIPFSIVCMIVGGQYE